LIKFFILFYFYCLNKYSDQLVCIVWSNITKVLAWPQNRTNTKNPYLEGACELAIVYIYISSQRRHQVVRILQLKFQSWCTKAISQGIWGHWVVGNGNEMGGGMLFIAYKKKKEKGTKTKKQVRLTEEFFPVFIIKNKLIKRLNLFM